MKRKIALMTWHHVENYGTAYQAYALSEVIKECGYDVDVIDYNRGESLALKKRSLKEYVQKLNFFNGFMKRKREYSFSSNCFQHFFDSRISYTSKCLYKKDFMVLNREYVGFVCGSDQIWGPNWFDSHYFLDFVQDKERKIAYAPSFGMSGISKHPVADQMRHLIMQFGSLSIREKSSCDEVAEWLEINNVFNAIDPVLLIDRKRWIDLAVTSQMDERPYGFIFFLKNNEMYFEEAFVHAKENGLERKVYHCTQSEDNRYANVAELTPEQMLGMIKNAAFVYTDSFHIMVLSIVFQVPFRVFDKHREKELSSQNRRLYDLMERLDIPKWKPGTELAYIDYSIVQKKLEIIQKDSMEYLSNALEAIPNDKSNVKSEKCDKYVKCKICAGEIPREVRKCLGKQEHAEETSKLWKNHMQPWNFTLCEKCYECDKLEEKRNIRRPLFYEELLKKFQEEENLRNIYDEFYKGYDIPFCIKQLLRKGVLK